MKAAVSTQYGGPEVLQIREVDKPQPKDDEVLIKVRAVSLNDWDWGLLAGSPWVNRTGGQKGPKVRILGSDVAGTVEAVGVNVKNFKAGDDVFGDLSGRWGGLAEYVCAKDSMLSIKPPKMSFEDAAAIPQAAMLAVQGLIDVGKVKARQKVLINGAGGGVGTFGIQIIKDLGVEMTGVDTASKLDLLKQVGYDHVIDYKKEDFTKTGKRYDLVFDVKTNRSIFSYARTLSPGGRYVTVGGSLGKILGIFLLGPLIFLFTGKHFRVGVLKPNKDLEYMKSLFNEGKVKPVIDGPYQLSQVQEAFRKFGSGEHKGKVIVVID